MQILLTTSGTLGDLHPFLALAQALVRRGHGVRLAVNPAMVGHVAAAGLHGVGLPERALGPSEARRSAGSWDHWDDRKRPPTSRRLVEEAAAVARALAGLCSGHDLLIGTAIRSHAGFAHRLTGIPWVTACVTPEVAWRPGEDERAEAGEAEVGEAEVADEGYLMQVGHELGVKMPDGLTGQALADRCYFAETTLLACSPAFFVPDGRVPTTFLQRCFWLYDDPRWRDWRPPPALAEFLARDPPPIVLSFSSLPLADPAQVLAVHARAAALLGRPLLVQAGWAGFGPEHLPPDVDRAAVFFAGELPHDWLFARVAAAIQHGGIGSLARALVQACPVLIEPWGNDQFFNALRVMELGLGGAAHPHRASAEGLADLLRKVLADDIRARVQAMSERLAGDATLDAVCADLSL